MENALVAVKEHPTFVSNATIAIAVIVRLKNWRP